MNHRITDIEKAQLEENKIRSNYKDSEDEAGENDYIAPIHKTETLKGLKVKSDPSNVSEEERKKSVKKLAGAISHSLRANGEINVRAFGPDCVSKAAKAISIAKRYIGTTNLKLDCSPAFITMNSVDRNITGICFCTFSSEKNEDDISCDRNLDDVKIKLMVKSDDRIEDELVRRTGVKKLAGAITHALEEEHEVILRCFGKSAINKAAKAIAIARGYTATRGPDLYCWPDFITADINGNNRTGIAFYCYTNEL